METLLEIERGLAEFGFSSKEAKTYLTLLKLGSQPASVIARELSLSRSTAQFILETLVKKQFANKMVRKKILYYTSEPPENLRIIMDLQKNAYLKKLEEKKEKIDGLLPQLSSIVTKSLIFPKIKYYEGMEGVKKLYIEMLERGENIDSIEDKGEMFESIGDFTKFFTDERIKRKIFNRVIAPQSNQINPTSKKELRETKFVDHKKYPLCGDIKITNSMVAIFDFTKSTPVAISIESQSMVTHFNILFNLMWDTLKG